MVDIMVTANGYKADDAVELITRPLEDIVKGIDDVRHVYSAAREVLGKPTVYSGTRTTTCTGR